MTNFIISCRPSPSAPNERQRNRHNKKVVRNQFEDDGDDLWIGSEVICEEAIEMRARGASFNVITIIGEWVVNFISHFFHCFRRSAAISHSAKNKQAENVFFSSFARDIFPPVLPLHFTSVSLRGIRASHDYASLKHQLKAGENGEGEDNKCGERLERSGIKKRSP